jgi:hypothetical protein
VNRRIPARMRLRIASLALCSEQLRTRFNGSAKWRARLGSARKVPLVVPFREFQFRIGKELGAGDLRLEACDLRLEGAEARQPQASSDRQKRTIIHVGRGMKTSLSPHRRTGPNRSMFRKAYAKTSEAAQGQSRRKLRAASLHHVMANAMSWMAPGDILLLEWTTALRECVDPAFHAILACPSCGKLDFITQKQYSGTEPVVCAHNDCSCHFRIDQRHHLTYLPFN